MSEKQKDPFFVGYLPMPAALVAYNKLVIVAAMLAGFGLGFWIASGQQGGGQGKVDKTVVALTGYLTMDPYPVLHHVGGEERSVLLIDKMKKSADHIVEGYANQWITLTGAMVQRGDWEMLVLPPGTEVVTATAKSALKLEDVVLGEVSLNGEIIDSKCYLGAMKPSSGKVHRACARLCLLGGVPPMFAAKNAEGTRYGYLLMNPDGSSAAIDLADKVAKPVNIKGTLVKRGDMQYIRMALDSIQQLAGTDLQDYGQTLEQRSVAELEGLAADPNRSSLKAGIYEFPLVCSTLPPSESMPASSADSEFNYQSIVQREHSRR